MTHKLPHKTDIGFFWNRYPTAEGCMKMHAFSELVITSSKTHAEGPFLPLQGVCLSLSQEPDKGPLRCLAGRILPIPEKGVGFFGDRPSEAELKQKNGLVRRCFRTGAFPLRQNYTKNAPKAFLVRYVWRVVFSEGFSQKRRAGGNTLLPLLPPFATSN